jgi:dihydroorotase
MKKTLIKNARIVTKDRIIHGCLVINDGKITEIIEGNRETFDGEVYDAQDKYLLPGLIETHGHFREPGLEHKEDIPHATRAALAGGFTTVFDMPNTKPPTTTVKLLHEQIARYTEKSYCDFAINLGSSVTDIGELEKVDPTEITGVKVFMAGHETTPTTVTRREDQDKIWEIAARRGFPVLAHAEDQELVTQREKALQDAGRTDMLAYSEARNEEVVIKAANIAVDLAIAHRTKLWILHASTKGEFDAIARARQKGITAGGEIAGYQLSFTTDDYKRLGARIKVSPALRSPEVNEVLWDMVRQGVIDGLCSEHTPHTLEEKNTDVWSAVSGMPDIQETVPAFITGWIKRFGKDTLEEGLLHLANMASTHVAEFFGYPQKSGIRVGNDADLVILDTEAPWKVEKKDLFTKLAWSAYEDMELVGRPVATFLRGTLVYKDGKIVGDRSGQWMKKNI